MLGSSRIDMAVIINTTSNKIETTYYRLVHIDTTIFFIKHCISNTIASQILHFIIYNYNICIKNENPKNKKLYL
jgi:hypothetical protein